MMQATSSFHLFWLIDRTALQHKFIAEVRAQSWSHLENNWKAVYGKQWLPDCPVWILACKNQYVAENFTLNHINLNMKMMLKWLIKGNMN